MFSTNLVVMQDQFQYQGKPRKFQDKGDSGMPVWRHFCGECGSPIFTIAESLPGAVIVKAGTLDTTAGLRPVKEVYASYAADWLAPLQVCSKAEDTQPS